MANHTLDLVAENVTNATQAVPDLETYLPGSETILSFLSSYLTSLPSSIKSGDFFAIFVALILGYFLIVIVNKLSGILLMVLKKTISLIVTIVALILIYVRFSTSLQTEGFSTNTIIIGVLAIAVAVLGTVITLYQWFKGTKEAIAYHTSDKAPQPYVQEQPKIDFNHMKEFKTFFSMDSLKNDKSMLSVLTFLVVAQFGVFSSATISAPNVTIGLIIFALFLGFSFLFIKQSYHSYKRGLFHLTITFVLGSILAVVLGHYWANIPFEVLFSLEVFQTESLVALVSGMALSLFAGSKS